MNRAYFLSSYDSVSYYVVKEPGQFPGPRASFFIYMKKFAILV